MEVIDATSRPSPRQLSGRSQQWVISLALLAVVLVTAEAVIRALDIQPFLLPTPSRVFGVLVTDRAYFWMHLRSTLHIMLLGTALSFAVSFVLATAMAHSRVLSRGLSPILVILKLVPTIAMAPLLVIWLGYGLRTHLTVVALITFFPIVVNLYTGLTEVDTAMVTLMRSQQATRRQIMRMLRIPHAVSYIFTSLRTAVPLSGIGAIVAEWVGADRGIGYIVKLDAALFRTAHVFAALLSIALAGILLFSAVVVVEGVVRRHERA